MNSKTKKIIAVTLVLLGVFSIVYLLVSNKKEETTVPNKLVVQPRIPNLLEHDTNIQTDIKRVDFDTIPKNLPLVKLIPQKQIQEDKIFGIAKNLGFDNNYNSFNDAEFGKMYLWNSEGKSLIIYSKSSKIIYSPGTSGSAFLKNLKQNDIIQIARLFLINNKLTSEQNLGTSLFYGLSSKNEEPSIVPFDEAVIYKIVFSPIIENIEVVTIDPFESSVSVWVDIKGSVIKVEINPIEISSKSEETYPLMNYNEFVQSVNESIIVNINDGNILPQDIKTEEILSIKAENIRVAYLKESYKVDYLQPIFIINGKINLSGNEKVNAILYLPALKN